MSSRFAAGLSKIKLASGRPESVESNPAAPEPPAFADAKPPSRRGSFREFARSERHRSGGCIEIFIESTVDRGALSGTVRQDDAKQLRVGRRPR